MSAADCPNGEGCNDQSHTCGSCLGPNASGGPYDCPPDAICSNYWSPSRTSIPGVCLADCDVSSCPASEPICAVYPGLTPDHKFCFGCLQDSDCASAGTNARCNLAPNSNVHLRVGELSAGSAWVTPPGLPRCAGEERGSRRLFF